MGYKNCRSKGRSKQAITAEGEEVAFAADEGDKQSAEM